MRVNLTKQQMVKEIVKCGKRPKHFINHYAKISHPQLGLIPFKLFDFQKELIDDYSDYRFNIVLKARQLGISTLTAAYVCWMMLFHREKTILIVATKRGTAGNLLKKVRTVYKNLPDWLKIADVEVDNAWTFGLTSGSVVKASSTSGDMGRSEALSLLVVDEAAHVEGIEEFWAGLRPTLSTGGRCILISTPYGQGNFFHRTYIDAELQKNNFHAVKLPWHAHPDRDDEWFVEETKDMTRLEIAQELLCSFNASGQTVIDPEDLNRIEEGICEPKYKTGFDRNYWIWKEYEPGSTYLLTGDVARGDGQDFSTFQIMKIETGEFVAEYQGKIEPDMFAPVVYNAGRDYGLCMVAIENNQLGYMVLQRLKEMGYPNLYYSKKSTHEHIDQYKAEYMAGSIIGFTMSRTTKPWVVAKLEEMIRNKTIKIYSKRLLEELRVFIWKNKRPEAMDKYNDDLVIAACISCWIRESAFVINKREVEYTKAILSSIGSINTKLDTKIPGQLGYKQKKMNQEADNYQKYSWLIKG